MARARYRDGPKRSTSRPIGRGAVWRLTGVVKAPGQGRVAVDMIGVGDELWMRFPAAPQLLPHGKRWVHVVDREGAPESLTPSQLARMLVDADDVQKLGEARVSGVGTTHYKATSRCPSRRGSHATGCPAASWSTSGSLAPP